MENSETRRQETEKKQLSMMNHAMRVFERLGMGLIFLDQNACITYANPVAAALLKKDRETFAGKNIQDISSGNLAKKLSKGVEQALREKTEITFELKSLDTFDLKLHIRCLPTDDGLAVILENITGVQDEEAPKVSRGIPEGGLAELESIYSSAPVGLCVLDADLKYVRINERLARLSGKPVSEHIGRPVEEVAPALAAHAKDIMHTIRETGEPVLNVEFTVESGPGKISAWRDHWLPIKDSTGRVVGVNIVMEDITEIKRTEQALRESEEHYRTLFETLAQGVLELDSQSRLVSSNAAARQILGIDLDVMKGRSIREIMSFFEEIIHEDGRQASHDELASEKALSTGMPVFGVLKCLKYQGRSAYRWVSINSVPIFKPGEGKPSGVFTSFTDITDLKDAQFKLRRAAEDLDLKVKERTKDLEETTRMLEEQKEFLQTLVDNTPAMLVILDPHGKVRFVNRQFENLMGWTLSEMQSMEDPIAPSYPDPEKLQEVKKFIREANGTFWDLEPLTKTGEVLQSSWRSVALSDGSSIGMGLDMRAQKKLREDFLRLATAINQAEEGVMLFSSEGMIQYNNPAYERMFGYAHGELIGKTAKALGPEVHAFYEGLFPRLRKELRPWSGHQKRRSKSGYIIDVNLSVSPVLDDAGRIMNFVSVIQDVTHETRLQRQLSQAQKMEAIGTLAGGIAHDLKNILTPILINAEIAMEDVGPESTVFPLLEEILGAARLGSELVKHILTFSQRSPHEKSPVKASDIVKDTLSFLRSSIPSTIEIRSRLEAEPDLILADPTQIKQVLMNLGSNAAHAMREKGGALEVDLAVVDLGREEVEQFSPDLNPGAYVRITVHDTGEGMSPEIMGHIFDLYFTTKKGEGTGMGLAVAYGIVREHGGAITVESTRGKGSMFTILLPKIS